MCVYPQQDLLILAELFRHLQHGVGDFLLSLLGALPTGPQFPAEIHR